MARNIIEEIVKEFANLVEDTWTEGITPENEQKIIEYLKTGNYSLVEDYPNIDPQKRGDFYWCASAIDKGDIEKNKIYTIRFLNLIMKKGGEKAIRRYIRRIQWEDVFKIMDLFVGEPYLGIERYIVYLLSEIPRTYNEREYVKLKEEFLNYENENLDIEKMVQESADIEIRLLLSALLYQRDEEKYSRIINSIFPNKEFEEDIRLMVFVLTHTSFEITAVKDKIILLLTKEERYKTADEILSKKYYVPELIDKSLFGKKSDDNSLECKMDFMYKFCQKLELSNADLLDVLLRQFGELNREKIFVSYFKKFDSGEIYDLFYRFTKDENNFYFYFLRLIFIELGLDMGVVRNRFVELFDEYFNKEVLRYLTLNYGSNDRQLYYHEGITDIPERPEINLKYGDIATDYIINGNEKRLSEIFTEEAKTYIGIRLKGEMYNFSIFCGYYAEEDEIKDKIKRFIHFIAYSGVYRASSRFLSRVMKHLEWSGEKIVNYYLDANAPIGSKLEVLNDIVFPHTLRIPKGVCVIDQEMADKLYPTVIEFLKGNEKETIEYLSKAEKLNGLIRPYYTNNPDANPEPLVKYLQIKNKQLREIAIEFLPAYPGARPMVEELQYSSKKDIRTYADKALAAMDKMNIIVLPKDVKKEETVDLDFDFEKYAKEKMPKNVDKLLVFTDVAKWPQVKDIQGRLVSPQVLKSYVGLYIQGKAVAYQFSAEQMAPYFNRDDMKKFSLLLYDHWKNYEEGEGYERQSAIPKYKGVMALFGIYAGDEAVKTLLEDITDFLKCSRSAMASECVKALTLTKTIKSLSAIDSLSRVHRNKQVRRVATETLEESAKALGLTVEQISDKIVPNLGFDEKGIIIFDTASDPNDPYGYGKPGRKYKLTLTQKMNVELYDSNNTLVKTLTYDHNLDDRKVHAEALGEISMIKKELKTIVKNQTERLELSMVKGREWNFADYKEFFLENSIMSNFAMTIIFGLYKDDTLKQSFRYSGDGTFYGLNGEVKIPEQVVIRIVHPCDLTKDELDRWKQDLDDFELIQYFPQLLRPLFNPEEIETDTYTEWKGITVSGYMCKQLFTFGWYMGGTGDGGSYGTIYYDDPHYEISACLVFSEDTCVGAEGEFPPTIDEVVFYKTCDVKPSYDLHISKGQIIPIRELSMKLYNNVIYRLKQAIDKYKMRED